VQRLAGEAAPPLRSPSLRLALAAVAVLALLPLAADRLCAGAADRHRLLRALRREPAFHHGAGRHDLLRPRPLISASAAMRRPCCSRARICRWRPALLLAPLCAGAFAVVYGWFCVRLSGVYLAMLTLAFAQISWVDCLSVDSLTGGSNGIVGVWPAGWLADKTVYYLSGIRTLRRGRRLAVARALLALRLRAARRPRFAVARRGDRHRPAGLSMGAFVLVARWRAWQGRSSPSPKAASRPPASPSRNRPTDWSWSCWAVSRR